MKALKFGLVAVLLSFVAVGFADNDPQHTFGRATYIKISLEDAAASRSFARAIYEQVDPVLIAGEELNRLYYAKVRYGRGIFLVFGKYREWEDFFLREGRIVGPPDWLPEPGSK